MLEWQKQRRELLEQAQAKSINKYSDVIKEVTGDRLQKYSIISDLDFCISKGYANNINDVWKLDDGYVTLSMCSDIENNDIQKKISDRIQQLNR